MHEVLPRKNLKSVFDDEKILTVAAFA